MDPPTLPPSLRPLLNSLSTVLQMLPSHPLNSDSTSRVESNALSYASTLHTYMTTISHHLTSLRSELSHLPQTPIPVDLLDLMDHGDGVNPSLWMLEAARVVKVMEEGVKGRRDVWERVRVRIKERDMEENIKGGGEGREKVEGREEEEEEEEEEVSPVAYLSDSLDLLALTYHNVLAMLRDYGSMVIEQGANKDGRRIRGEMAGATYGLKSRKLEEPSSSTSDFFNDRGKVFVDKAVEMVKEGEGRVERGMEMVKKEFDRDFKGEVEEIERLQGEIDELERILKAKKEEGATLAKETEVVLDEMVEESLNNV